MRFGSVCSGIGAPEYAWRQLGWECAYVAEIAPFPSAVLRHHFPEVKNHGDFTKIKGGNGIDLLVGGTPCQSFSVTGLRAGLADPRGNLALAFLALLDRERPRWMVWENVPGVLSSVSHDAPDEVPPPDDLQPGCEWTTEQEYDADEVPDFGCFLAGLSELGYEWAYRTLDAQYAGVPQRRRRIFVVGYLGDGRPPCAVLFERHSLSGHPPPRRQARQGVAASLKGRSGNNGSPERGDLNDVQIAHSLRADGHDASEDGTGRGTPPVAYPCVYDTTQVTSKTNRSSPQAGETEHPLAAGGDPPLLVTSFTCKDSGADAGEVAPTLRSMEHDGSHANAGGQIAVAFNWQAGDGGSDDSFRGKSRSWITRAGDYTGALGATKRDAVAIQYAGQLGREKRRNGMGVGDEGAPMFTLETRQAHGVKTPCAPRRLTPLECERLQGFEDGWTAIRYRKKPAADGPRYHALGNSMAVPVVRWIGERIAKVEAVIASTGRGA